MIIRKLHKTLDHTAELLTALQVLVSLILIVQLFKLGFIFFKNNLNQQKQPFVEVLQSRYTEKSLKIHRKILALESLFNKVANPHS